MAQAGPPLNLMLAQANPPITWYDPGRDDPPAALLALDLEDALRRFTQDGNRLV